PISVETAAVDVLHRDRRQVDAVQTSDVDAPEVRRRARPPEGKDPAGRAGVVPRRLRAPPEARELLARGRHEAEGGVLDAMSERAALAADGAVAQADVVEVGVHLETHLPAVARSGIGPRHLPPTT